MIITLASSKGGVGKSTTTASLGGAFAHAGYRVHIIDLDSNHTVSRWLGDAGRSSPRLTVSAADPQDLTEHLAEIARKHKPDVTLIDIAGTYERALTVAIARAHLTIIPAGPSEADIFEAARVARHIRSVFQAFGRDPLYRLLLTRVQPWQPRPDPCLRRDCTIEAACIRDGDPSSRRVCRDRPLRPDAAFCGRKRPTVEKAVVELDALLAEINAVVGIASETVLEQGAA